MCQVAAYLIFVRICAEQSSLGASHWHRAQVHISCWNGGSSSSTPVYIFPAQTVVMPYNFFASIIEEFAAEAVCFQVCCPSSIRLLFIRPLFFNVYFTWHNISLLNGGISVKTWHKYSTYDSIAEWFYHSISSLQSNDQDNDQTECGNGRDMHFNVRHLCLSSVAFYVFMFYTFLLHFCWVKYIKCCSLHAVLAVLFITCICREVIHKYVENSRCY